MPPGAYIAPAAYAYIAMPAYIPFRGAYTAVFIATLGSMAHTDIKFHGSYHQPTLSSSYDNNLLILTEGSNRVTRKHSSVTLWLPGFSQKTSNSLMFWGPVDSSSCSSSPSRVATEGRKGLRGHSGDFMATLASSIDLKQSFRVSEKTLSTLSLSLVCLFVCLLYLSWSISWFPQ